MQETNGGRAQQKARTYNDLLRTAVDLIRGGRRPTIEEVAAAAGVSRRTAYRYFSSQDQLLADATWESLRPALEETLVSAGPTPDAVERIAALASAMARTCATREDELRTLLRLSVDKNPLGPMSVRDAWIERALEPVRESMGPEAFKSLVSALCVTLGIHAFTVLRDIRHLSDEEIERMQVKIARTLVRAALTEAGLTP
ncbi:MAG TPA: helix-turn-helix domain-containing protein [Phenylobacterium sp.]|nr:helix-turn-helix domain-containing protein [Phenylobacterium sp.]